MVLPVQEVRSSLDISFGESAPKMCEVQDSSVESGRSAHRCRAFTSARIRHVYLVGMTFDGMDHQSEKEGIIKIGIADDVYTRFQQIQAAYDVEPKPPFSPAWFSYAECRYEDAKRIESYLHRKFSKYRLNGEWFRMPTELIESIPMHGQWDVPWQCISPICWCVEQHYGDQPLLGTA